MAFDGVVHRTPVRAPAGDRARGPTCGDQSALVGTKGAGSEGSPLNIPPERAYRIGPGDDLKFNIFGEEGMTDLTARVDAEGYVQLPMVEAVDVAGDTTRELQGKLKQYYGEFFVDPWITVELAKAESQPIYFLGEFREPGTYYLEFATELVEALAMPEGVEEDAFLRGARLLRGNRVCTVDIYALLKDGDFSQNVWVQPRDVIYVPLKEEMRVYMLGAVESPGAIPFGPEGRTLMESISLVGGFVTRDAELTEVRIIRSFGPTTGELIVVNVEKMLTGRGLDFPLEPGDVVYVPRTPLGSWNVAVETILPSLQLIGGILTPLALIDSLLIRR
ncbi:MAG: polysaccharide biosynthesis/export family protein [Rhodobacteraceae bacterium]|nr:polysaccharide biosynthesis/export family protein [Paracoccaceae bacterium]